MKDTSGAVRLRLLTGLILALIGVVLIWTPTLHIGFTLFITLLIAVGLYEYYAMAKKCGLDVESESGIFVGICVVLSAYFPETSMMAAVFTLGCGLLAFMHMARNRHSLPGLASTLFGVVYVAWLGSHLVALHGIHQLGPGLVTLIIGAVALSDTGAYFIGSSIGKHKVAPALSPKKTWEGTFGGIILAILLMVFVYTIRPHLPMTIMFPDWSLLKYIILGVVLSIAGQIGDFMESMLKRNAGVKDSGAFFLDMVVSWTAVMDSSLPVRSCTI